MKRHIVALTLLTLMAASAVEAQRTLTDPNAKPTGPAPPVNDHGTVGTLTTYPDRDSFRAVHPGLAMEDFTGTLVADGEVVSCPAPLSSGTDDDCFPRDGVIPGFRYDVIQDGGWDTDYAAVNNALELGCVGIGPNFFVNETDWVFKPPVAAVAMDVYTPLDFNETFTIEVFSEIGSLGTLNFQSAGTEAAFFGVDTIDPAGIHRIEIREILEDRGEVFCDLEFGDATVPVELQSVGVE